MSGTNTTTTTSAGNQRSPGRAVANGKIRYLSVSQVTTFSPDDGGCPRRWAFQKIFGKKEEQTAQQAAGVKLAQELEHYLKTGEDVLSPITRAGKHLLPAPGADLEVEKPLGDIHEAIRLRESGADLRLVLAASGLTAEGIPFMGAADIRHRRGFYVNADGALTAEDFRVVEVVDHKTTSRINPHTTRTGKVLHGWAKSVEEILNTPQMIGYCVHAANRNPDVSHVRLSHIYYQRDNGYAAVKRTGLLSVEDGRRRWERIEQIVREMQDVAKVTVPEEAPVNLGACRAFGRDCPHSSYCDRPKGSVSDLLSLSRTPKSDNGYSSTPTATGEKMDSLFDMMKNGTTNHAPASSTAPIPPPVATTDADRQAVIASEKAKIMTQMMTPPALPVQDPIAEAKAKLANGTMRPDGNSGLVFDKTGADAGWIHRHATTAEKIAIEEMSAKTVSISAINPPDAPPLNPVAAAAPLSPQVIATLTDPELKARAEAHAAAAAAAAANPTAEKKEKTGGRCSTGGTTFAPTPADAAAKKKACPACGKTVKLEFSPDFSSATWAKHNMAKAEEATIPTAPPPPATPPAMAQTTPPPIPPAIHMAAPPIVAAPTSFDQKAAVIAKIDEVVSGMLALKSMIASLP